MMPDYLRQKRVLRRVTLALDISRPFGMKLTSASFVVHGMSSAYTFSSRHLLVMR